MRKPMTRGRSPHITRGDRFIRGRMSEAKSLVLIADDPDAPSGLFTHWLIWNVPPQTNSVAEGSAPKSV